MADEIKYSDIISPEVQKQLDELTATVRELTRELEQLSKATQSEEKASTGYNETLRDTVDITEDLIRLTQEEKELKDNLEKTQRKYTAALKDGNTEADAYAIAIKKGKEELSKHGFVLKNATKLAIAQKTSMTELSLELGKNRMRYRNLTKAERDNDKIGGKLLKTIKTQDAAIKKLDKTIGNTQRNVGNYTKSMGKASVATKKWGRNIAFIAVGALVGAAKNMQAASDTIEDVSNVAVIAIGNLAKAAKGEISWGDALNGEAIWDAAKAMTEVNRKADYLRALQDKETSALRFRIEQQKLLQNDTREDYDTRITANINLNKLLDHSDSIIKSHYETRKEQFVEILKNDKDNIAAQTSLLQLEKERDDNLRQNAVTRTEIQRAEIALTKESETAHHDLLNLQNQAAIDRFNSFKQSYDAQRDFADAIYQAELVILDERYAGAKKFSEDWYKLLAEQEAAYNEYSNNIRDIDAEQRAVMFDNVQSVASSASMVLGEFAEDNKNIQIAQAIINTFAAAVAVLAQEQGGYVVRAIAAAATIATGLANVIKIQNTAIPSYATGAEELESDQMANVHKGERILPAYLNKQIGGIDNIDLPRLVNIGLNAPKIFDGIEDMIAQQQSTNNLLSRFAYVEKNGTVIYLSGDKKYYV